MRSVDIKSSRTSAEWTLRCFIACFSSVFVGNLVPDLKNQILNLRLVRLLNSEGARSIFWAFIFPTDSLTWRLLQLSWFNHEWKRLTTAFKISGSLITKKYKSTTPRVHFSKTHPPGAYAAIPRKSEVNISKSACPTFNKKYIPAHLLGKNTANSKLNSPTAADLTD